MFSPLATCGIAVCLSVPFGLRIVSTRLEPHPAILLPAGASIVNVGGHEVVFGRAVLWALEPSEPGGWVEIDPGELLAPVPVHFFEALASNDFGLVRRADEPILLRYIWRHVTLPRHRPSDDEVMRTRAWLAARLGRLGVDSTAMRVTWERLRLELPSGRALAREVIADRYYQLDAPAD